MSEKTPERWLRGPVPEVAPLLQPVAHALLHARDEIETASDLTPAQLWARPGGAASVGFHLRHIAGSLDRLLTYARRGVLDQAQKAFLAQEKEPGDPPVRADVLVALAQRAVDRALDQVRATPEDTLLEPRKVGRAELPSTVIGLLFHAAEHAARHAGQVVTTARFVRSPGAAPAGD